MKKRTELEAGLGEAAGEAGRPTEPPGIPVAGGGDGARGAGEAGEAGGTGGAAEGRERGQPLPNPITAEQMAVLMDRLTVVSQPVLIGQIN